MDLGSSKQVSTHSNDPVPNERISIRMVQNVLLVWLDNNIDDNNADCRNTITQLRRAVNTISKFTNGDECVEFVESIGNEKACMIISGSLGQHIVPRIHNMSQVDSIFIFCGNKKYHEQWTKDWSKIKGVFTEISPICEALKKAAQQCEQNAMPLSFMITSGDISKRKLDQLEPTFMYSQILKEILLEIKFEVQHFVKFIKYCREVLADNEDELKNLEKFQKKYYDETPIWWYTFECFLYPMLNRSLRLMNVDIIIKMGFFIGDLHRHIQQLHKEQFGSPESNKPFKVYRGQGISKTDFEQMTKTKGGLMSFNNFLSTSKDRDISLNFACSTVPNPDLVGILFVMMIDPSQSTTPFASVNDVSYFKDNEHEILFAMHTVFRIGDITSMGENHRLFQVELTLTSDTDEDLRILTDSIREETDPDDEGWYRLGHMLMIIDQSDKAQQVYEVLLEQATNEGEKTHIYKQLGAAKYRQEEYQEAITLYEKALEIEKKSLSPNHSNLASSYNNSGLVYFEMGEYSKALSYHEKALKFRKQSLPPNHPDLANSYDHIGLVYSNMSEYSKALSAHEKALEIRNQSLPPNHPDLANSYSNIGGVYYNTDEYRKALSSSEKALEIRKKSLPPNHPDLAATYDNIGKVYFIMGEYSKALPFYERAVDIGQRSLPSNHPRLQRWRNYLEDLKKKL